MRVISIDGPAGAGKSSVARRLAELEGWAYLDSGAMYRAVTLLALRRAIALEDVERLADLARRTTLELGADGRVRADGEDLTSQIRSAEVDRSVSLVARIPEVREVMVRHQRRFAAQHDCVVAEGRDMGTVVFPDAAVKVYLEADAAERARRRAGENAERGGATEDTEAVRRALEDRDRLDSERRVAPLRPAADAWRLDTSRMTLHQVVEAVRARVRSAIRP
jgi:cytidylate kinase